MTLVTLSTVLIAWTALLAPGQSVRAYGAEVLAIGVVALALVAVLQWRSYRANPPALLAQELARARSAIAAAVLLAGWEGGVYWMLPPVIPSFLSVLLNSWVLLIEIKRETSSQGGSPGWPRRAPLTSPTRVRHAPEWR